jgi:transcriptional regulator with XRE-family HTH domain
MGSLIAKNLRLFNLRHEHGLTQIDAAKKMDIPIIVYQRIEQGKTSGRVETWDKVQKFYKVPDEEMWKIIKNRGD